MQFLQFLLMERKKEKRHDQLPLAKKLLFRLTLKKTKTKCWPRSIFETGYSSEQNSHLVQFVTLENDVYLVLSLCFSYADWTNDFQIECLLEIFLDKTCSSKNHLCHEQFQFWLTLFCLCQTSLICIQKSLLEKKSCKQ